MSFSGLRILLVGPLPPPAGGMASLTRQLADLLDGEGARVELVQNNAPYRPAWAGRLPGVRALFRLLPYLVALWRACGRADLMHLMANSGWSWHLFAAPAIWIARLRGTPVIVNYHGGEAATFLAGAARWVLPSLRQAQAIVVPSGFLVEVFARYGLAARIVPNVVDLQLFTPRSAAEQGADAPHILLARNLEAIYGVDVALKAFARLVAVFPGARMSVTGSGPARASLAAQAEALGIAGKVCFTGRLERARMAELFRSADILLNPSRADNLPGALLEALASAVPVVATRVGGVPHVVEHGRTALLVPVDDDLAMADAMLTLLRDKALAARLVEAGRAQVIRYEWKSVRPQLLAEYRAVLQPGGAIV